jgi:hypothetical protein
LDVLGRVKAPDLEVGIADCLRRKIGDAGVALRQWLGTHRVEDGQASPVPIISQSFIKNYRRTAIDCNSILKRMVSEAGYSQLSATARNVRATTSGHDQREWDKG